MIACKHDDRAPAKYGCGREPTAAAGDQDQRRRGEGESNVRADTNRRVLPGGWLPVCLTMRRTSLLVAEVFQSQQVIEVMPRHPAKGIGDDVATDDDLHDAKTRSSMGVRTF